tara:strand:- start:8173 stop:9141 length:969 start_codon:yes stop_codon:yes gene_type:complete
MAIIISGGAGFIGTNLSKELLKKNSKIFILDNFSNGKKIFINNLQKNHLLKVIECDLSIEREIDNAIKTALTESESIEEIWHLAANSDIPSGIINPNIDLRDTFMTTFNLLEMARKYKIKSFYFASSSAVYGDHGIKNIEENTGPLMPISNYGAMKLASEAQCFAAYESFLKRLRIFRFPNVVGTPATHGVIFDFINKLKKNNKSLEVLGDGSQQKSYLHVDDLISGMIFLSEIDLDKNETPIFNLGPEDDSVKVKWIAEQVVLKVSPNAKIIYGNKNKGWLGDIPKFSYRTKKAKKLGWQPKMNSKESVLKAIDEIIKENF